MSSRMAARTDRPVGLGEAMTPKERAEAVYEQIGGDVSPDEDIGVIRARGTR